MQSVRHGNLFIVSGPSGAGKGTLVSQVISSVPDAWISVSATTRQPRAEEIDGESYYFLSMERFNQLVKEDGLLEWAEVYGNRYGTPRQPVEDKISDGNQVILEIDVQGAFQVLEKMPEAILIFIEPPSLAELEARLVGRNTECANDVERRLSAAKRELEHKTRYTHIVVNDTVQRASRELISIIDTYANR